MLQTRRSQLAIFVVLFVAILGVGYWHIFVHPGHPHLPDVASAKSAPSADDTQIDTQGDANVTVTYRPDLSTSQAVFDIGITSDTVALTGYNYKAGLVLTDANINPLPSRSISASLVKKSELKVRYTSDRFPGNHFHFDVRNLGGIEDRVLHFYRTL